MGVYGANLTWGDHVAILGIQQTGKTTLALALTRGARRVVYVSPKGDYALKVRGAIVGPPIVLEDVPWDEPRLRVCVLLGRDGDVDPSDEVRYVIRKVRENAGGDASGSASRGIVLVLDEVNLYGQGAGPVIKTLLAAGHGIAPRYGGVVTVLVSQRGVDVPLGGRALLTRCYSYRQEHPADRARLRDEFGSAFARTAHKWSAGEEPAYWEQEKFYRK